MKRFAYRFFWACILLLLTSLSVRLFWLAAGMETGLQTLRIQWRDATIGWFVGNYQPIPQREPSEQADFWLREVDRVIEAHPQDARLAMGAALVLDSPGIGFTYRYIKRADRIPGLGMFPELDREGLNRAINAFEKRCKTRCLELAGRAVELDPQNPTWRRLRALLLLHDVLYSSDNTPRDPRWLEILNECARHDPDNALYDYLAADFYWKNSSDWDFSGNQDRLVIHDNNQFNKGIVCFERGQAKKHFSVGDAGFPTVQEFLRRTRIPLTDQESTVNSRGIHLHRGTLLYGLWRWQRLRAAEKAIVGDVKAALALERQNLRMIAQYSGQNASTAYDSIAMASKVATATTMKTLADKHPDSLSDSEVQQIAKLQKTTLLERNVIDQAGRELAKGKPCPSAGLTFPAARVAVAESFVVGFTPSLVVLLLSIGVVAFIVSRRFAGSEAPAVGPVGQTLALLLALTFTAALLGLAPAEIISRDVQAWVFTICLLLMPVAVVTWLGWLWLRYRRFQYSLRALLIVTFIFSLFFSFVAVIRSAGGSFVELPFTISMPARGWEGVDPGLLRNVLTPGGEKWLWAVFQWAVYSGPYLTLLVWAVLVAILYGLRWKKWRRQTAAAAPLWRRWLGGLSRSIARPALLMSALMLLIYLLLTPSFLEQVEQDFQQKIAFARRPEDHWDKVEKAVQKVRADEKLMGQLRGSVKTELSRPENSPSE